MGGVNKSHFGEADCLDDGVQMGFGLRKASSTAGVKAFLPYEKATKTTSARTPVSMGCEGGASGIEWQLWEHNPSVLLFEGDLMTYRQSLTSCIRIRKEPRYHENNGQESISYASVTTKGDRSAKKCGFLPPQYGAAIKKEGGPSEKRRTPSMTKTNFSQFFASANYNQNWADRRRLVVKVDDHERHEQRRL